MAKITYERGEVSDSIRVQLDLPEPIIHSCYFDD